MSIFPFTITHCINKLIKYLHDRREYKGNNIEKPIIKRGRKKVEIKEKGCKQID